jgi:hypothetical protein
MFVMCKTVMQRRSHTPSKPTPIAGGAVAILSRLSASDGGIFAVRCQVLRDDLQRSEYADFFR